LQAAFQDWFLGFWHQRSEASWVQAQIELLENDIAEEKKKIAALDKQLREESSLQEEKKNIAALDKELREKSSLQDSTTQDRQAA